MNRIGTLALLALAGCGYSSYWPQAGPFETGETGLVEPQIPCGTPDGTPVQLTLYNVLPDPLQIARMHPTTCAEEYHGDVPPYEATVLSAATGEVWFSVSPQGVPLRWFEIPAGVSEWSEQIP